MKIIAHRGYWHTQDEKNTSSAFSRAFQSGFGVETDVRDHNGELVIAHDVPICDQHYLSFDSFLEIYSRTAKQDVYLAINIKADGLQHLISGAVRRHKLENYFVFDMSIPMLVFGYSKSSIKYYCTLNEHMQTPAISDGNAGIWLDAYYDIWYDINLISRFLQAGKPVCIVSPELHGRDHTPLWNIIRAAQIHKAPQILLCTDLPADAASFFSV